MLARERKAFKNVSSGTSLETAKGKSSLASASLGAISLADGAAVQFTLPNDTFVLGRPTANLNLDVRQADGQALPG